MRSWRWTGGSERGQAGRVATSCSVKDTAARPCGEFLGVLKEAKAGDGMVLLSTVCEKWRYAEMKGAMGCEHVGGDGS